MIYSNKLNSNILYMSPQQMLLSRWQILKNWKTNPHILPVWKNQIHWCFKMNKLVTIVHRLFSTKTWDNSKKSSRLIPNYLFFFFSKYECAARLKITVNISSCLVQPKFLENKKLLRNERSFKRLLKRNSWFKKYLKIMRTSLLELSVGSFFSSSNFLLLRTLHCCATVSQSWVWTMSKDLEMIFCKEMIFYKREVRIQSVVGIMKIV